MDETNSQSQKVDRSMAEQARFISHCIEHEITVTIFMGSGASLMGIPRLFDGKCLLLGYRNPEKIPKLIYTSYVTLIRADEVLNLRDEFRGEDVALKKLRKKASRMKPSQNHLEPMKH